MNNDGASECLCNVAALCSLHSLYDSLAGIPTWKHCLALKELCYGSRELGNGG